MICAMTGTLYFLVENTSMSFQNLTIEEHERPPDEIRLSMFGVSSEATVANVDEPNYIFSPMYGPEDYKACVDVVSFMH